ncbi:MAG TPA: branched-chain amino acid ABC transporter substrate-binding protein [Anaerolineae bacterium]|nr:branched-chain amino acid ABC transporter substrate-binding protein [Anaerolineae bacterium]
MRNQVILLLVLLISLTSACSAGPKGVVVVYVSAPLSGFQANGGQTVVGGVRLAAAQINRAGGLLGKEIKIIALDDESDSDVAVTVAEQIKEAVQRGDPILGVIGHYNSGQTLAAMEIYKDLPIIVITPTASEVSLTHRGYRNFFRVNANDAVQARVDADFLVNTLDAHRIAVIHNDTEYGVGLRDQITRELERLGAQVVLTLQVAEGQGRYLQEVAQVQQAAPDAIFYAGYEIEAPYLRADLVEAGVKIPMLASDGAFLAATIDESAGTAEGMYVSAFAPSPKTAVDAAWIEAYQAVEFRNPDTYSINGYSALKVLAEAVKQAKSFTADKVIKALHQIDVQTPIGRVRYDEHGDLRDPPVYIFQVQGGEFVQVAPTP